jgi:DNA-binding GntR family transcriptional regulator
VYEHQAIYEALRQHDGEAAARALTTHIDNAYLRSNNAENNPF